tara:strand:+ start:4283 stop:4906 length:624 start_codon:yes stop_codon:yes gene_type:complete
MKHKAWCNEDSLAAHVLSDESLLVAVADAHFGGRASELCVQRLLPAFLASEGLLHERLERTVERIDQELLDDKEETNELSESTCLIVHVSGRNVHFVNVGDSLLFVCKDGQVDKKNALSMRFLPLRYSIVGPSWDFGAFEVEEGSVLLLATDGIEEECSNLLYDELGTFFQAEDEDLQDQLRSLLVRADDREQGGGRDNLGLIAIRC